MWYLVCPDKDGRSYRLTRDKDEHVVSRTNGDIILSGDQSVSRKHAVFTFDSDNSGKAVVIIKDLNSKYGTYVNGSFKLEPNNPHQLADGDVITFGCQWNKWSFHSKPLVVTTSTMSNEAKGKVRRIISELGGTVVGDWQESCSHLTMVDILLTAKVVCALASGIPIVTPEYWDHFKEAIDEQKLPPSCEQYIPPLKESILNKNKVSFAVNEKRRNLFSGKTFVFSAEKQLKKYKTIVLAAGGSCQTLQDCDMSLDELCGPDVIVMQHVTITDTQPSAVYDHLFRKMKDKGLKPIPESEIGLAVLMCSLETYCNMNYNVIGNVLEGGVKMSQVKRSEVLAADSQMSVFDSVTFKTEDPAIKTENVESGKGSSTPVLSITGNVSLPSCGSSSSRERQNNEETLPSGFDETLQTNDTSIDKDASPFIAPGPSRKRPSAVEVVEPPAKRNPSEGRTPRPMEKNTQRGEDFMIGDNTPRSNKSSNGMNENGNTPCSVTSKRKLDEMDFGYRIGGSQKRVTRPQPTSALFSFFDEIPPTSKRGLSVELEVDGEDQRHKEKEKAAKIPLFSNWEALPSTSKNLREWEAEDEELQWQKEGAKGLKKLLSSDWGAKLKELDAKRPGGLKDTGIGMVVKMASLVVNDKVKQKRTESPVDPSVVNFKKFRKVKSVGNKSSLPVIIGGSDLVPYQGDDVDF